MMEEWEEAANNRIRFKEVNDGLDEFGYPRFKIEQNTGVSTAFVSGGVGANVWHSTLKYNPGSFSGIGNANNHGPTNVTRDVSTALISFTSDYWSVSESTDVVETGETSKR